MAKWGDLHEVNDGVNSGWKVYWRISQAYGSGLEVWFADFKGKRVLWRGTQPFAIVPYHNPLPATSWPQAPDFTFKDGINPQCGGVTFNALNHDALNVNGKLAAHATIDTDAVVVKTYKPPDDTTDFGPKQMTVSAKFECGWYQYVHRWEFDSYGNIHAHVAMGGALNPGPGAKDKAHTHHMYFRLDLDIDGFPNDVFEVFNHQEFLDPAAGKGDIWGDGLGASTPVSKQGKLFANPASSRKWRVRDTKSKSALGQHKGYEIEVPQLGGTDTQSTGDVWVTVYRGDSVQQGAEVATAAGDCTDKVLENVYAVGPLDTVNGNDIVVWVAIHAHHEPRNNGEENDHLPYHYHEFSISPRNFEVFGPPTGHEG